MRTRTHTHTHTHTYIHTREAVRKQQVERDQQLARDSISKEQVELARQRQRQLELSESEARRLEGAQGGQLNRQGSVSSTAAPNIRPQGPGGNQQSSSLPGTLNGSQQPRPPGATSSQSRSPGVTSSQPRPPGTTSSQPRPQGPGPHHLTPPGPASTTRVGTSGGSPKPQAPGQSSQGVAEGDIRRFNQMQLQGGGANSQGGGSLRATDATNRGSRQQRRLVCVVRMEMPTPWRWAGWLGKGYIA